MDQVQEAQVMQHTNGLVLNGLTKEDFSTAKPYAMLYSMRLSRFEQRRALNALIDYGVSLGVKKLNILQLWNDYVADQKPAVVIGSNAVIEFPEQEKVLGENVTMSCGKYVCDSGGVYYYGQMGEKVTVIKHPFLPVRRIVDVETNLENIKLAYCRVDESGNDEEGAKAEWKQLIVPKDVVSSAQRIVALSKNGIAVTSENAREVVKYISEIEELNYFKMATQLSCSHMGWLNNGKFSPYAKDVVFGGDNEEYKQLYNGIHPEGDEDKWMETALAVRNGKSVPARIALAASFAAPLVQKLGALSFFVHFWGLQGTGKTVALMLGASVWGNPALGTYVKSFNATKVHQEKFAAFCGNLPVFLDELQVLADRKLFDDIIYSLCEGVSKGRGTKDGGLQATMRWATVFLTTGEMPIVQHNSGGGAAVRTIEVNYGGEPFFDDARGTANTLKENYGWAGKRFIEALSQDDAHERIMAAQNEFYKAMSKDIQDKQTLSASVLLSADKFADDVLFHDGKALTVDEIRQYLVSQEQADQNRRAYQWLIGEISGNAKRFDPEENSNELWGVWDAENDKLLYFNRAYFDKLLQSEGYSSGSFLNWARQHGKIKVNEYSVGDRNKRLTIRKRIGGVVTHCVALYMPDDDEDPNFVDVTKDEQLPFMQDV